MIFQPTEEQLAAVAATKNSKDSILLEAYAGCAKTTTLTLMAHEIKIPSLALAFHVRIKEELTRVFPKNFSVQTMNGLGFMSMKRALPAIDFKVDTTGKKLGSIIKETIKNYKIDLSAEQWDVLRAFVKQIMLIGLVPKGKFSSSPLVPDDEWQWSTVMEDLNIPEGEQEMMQEIARDIIIENINQALRGFISYDDQIYVSTLVAGRFPQFPILLGDEIQDFSPLNHAMLTRSVRPDGRLLMVGDQRQGIYAFRGADINSIAKIKALRAKWIELPLTMTFRCPQIVVSRQLKHAPGFRAAPTNLKGLFAKLPLAQGALLDPDERPGWDWTDVERLAPAGASLAVLCRNNAPIVKLAFRLLRKRISINMLGRDIGSGLISMSRNLFKDDTTPSLSMANTITEWEEREKALAIANGQEEKLNNIEDKAEALRAVLSFDHVENAGDLRREIKHLFAQEGGKVTLSSIHKAKGLEWDLVVLLDPWRMPSKSARESASRGDDTELQQEMNLKYVAETRTKNVLIHANVEDFGVK